MLLAALLATMPLVIPAGAAPDTPPPQSQTRATLRLRNVREMVVECARKDPAIAACDLTSALRELDELELDLGDQTFRAAEAAARRECRDLQETDGGWSDPYGGPRTDSCLGGDF